MPSPFALFPVRIETRFATVASGDADEASALGAHLSGRLLDRHLRAACCRRPSSPTRKLYWQNICRAGGVEADQRAAWRSLVAAHGSGRAGYIVDTYQPTNLPPPAKAAATDEILVIPTQTPLPAAEAAAIAAYWQAVWLADGDLARQQDGARPRSTPRSAPRAPPSSSPAIALQSRRPADAAARQEAASRSPPRS